MKISFHYNYPSFRIRESGRHKRLLQAIFSDYAKGSQVELSYVFTTRSDMLIINQEFLDHDYDTDVITFDYGEDGFVQSEIYIGVEAVRENAAEYGVSLSAEMRRVIVHAALHLVGFGDLTCEERAVMREKEEYYLNLYRDAL